MPRNQNPVQQMESLPLAERIQQPLHGQEHWYLLAGILMANCSVLDVGAGSGHGTAILRMQGAEPVLGIDLSPAGGDVQQIPIDLLGDYRFDFAVAMDVIEHVDDDRSFFDHLLRVARQGAFFTTPNWNVWHCQNPFHVREYTPEELIELLGDREYIAWTCGQNRITDPPRRISRLEDADAAFAVLVRRDADFATWNHLAHLVGDLYIEIPYEECLSALTWTSEEWAERARTAAQEGPGGPLEAAERVIAWLQEHCPVRPMSPKETAIGEVTKILRYGLCSPLQHAIVLAWALNAFVLGPEGPHVNQAKNEPSSTGEEKEK